MRHNLRAALGGAVIAALSLAVALPGGVASAKHVKPVKGTCTGLGLSAGSPPLSRRIFRRRCRAAQTPRRPAGAPPPWF